jgi:ABC-2 type transport system permease protein
MMVSMAAFGAMSAATVAAAGPPPSTPVRHPSGTTISARIASAMVLAVVPLLLLGLAGSFDGVRLPAGEWVALATGLWLGALPFVALGLLLGPVLDAETGDVVLPAVLVVLAIVGGLFQPTETFPDVLATVASVVPSYHLADLGWTAIAGRAVDPVDVIVQTGYTLAIGALVLWRNWSEGRRVEA